MSRKPPRPKPNLSEVRRFLSYDPVTGYLTWKLRCGTMAAGSLAGSLGRKGYVTVQIFGRLIQAHIIAWALMTGEWPDHEVDHRDGVRHRNVWENLRPATEAQQSQNQKIRSDNLSGFKGVSKRRHNWIARINVDGKRLNLGRFPTPEAGHEAYMAAAAEHFGEYAREK